MVQCRTEMRMISWMCDVEMKDELFHVEVKHRLRNENTGHNDCAAT